MLMAYQFMILAFAVIVILYLAYLGSINDTCCYGDEPVRQLKYRPRHRFCDMNWSAKHAQR